MCCSGPGWPALDTLWGKIFFVWTPESFHDYLQLYPNLENALCFVSAVDGNSGDDGGTTVTDPAGVFIQTYDSLSWSSPVTAAQISSFTKRVSSLSCIQDQDMIVIQHTPIATSTFCHPRSGRLHEARSACCLSTILISKLAAMPGAACFRLQGNAHLQKLVLALHIHGKFASCHVIQTSIMHHPQSFWLQHQGQCCFQILQHRGCSNHMHMPIHIMISFDT